MQDLHDSCFFIYYYYTILKMLEYGYFYEKSRLKLLLYGGVVIGEGHARCSETLQVGKKNKNFKMAANAIGEGCVKHNTN